MLTEAKVHLVKFAVFIDWFATLLSTTYKKLETIKLLEANPSTDKSTKKAAASY